MNITKLCSNFLSIAFIAISCLPNLHAMQQNQNHRNEFIQGASYCILERGESISNIVPIYAYHALFYTFDGNFIAKLEYNQGIKKIIDPHAPKPQPVKYTVLHHPDTKQYKGSPACIIRFYDKNNNEIVACVYNQEAKIIQAKIANFSYDLTMPHIIDANFPLDLSRLR